MAEPSGSDRRLLIASLLFLALATAAGFGRVFAGGGATVRLAVAAAVSVLVATVFVRRNLVLGLAGSAVALLVVLGILVYRDTLWFGVPGPGTLEGIARSLEHLGRDAAREIAPAPALSSLMTAALIAVWAAATAAHALAVRARSPILALLPGAVLIAFAGVVTAEPPRPLFAIPYLVAAIGVLYGASLERLHTWGPLLERRGRRALAGGSTGRWARRLGVAAAAVAVAMPGVLPGLGASPLMTVDPGRDGGTVSINAIVDMRPALLQQPVSELFVVDAPRPAYWRLLSLDRFDGRTWTSTDSRARHGRILDGAQLPGESDARGWGLVQTFEIRSLSVPWLPAAYRPVEIDGDADADRWDPDAGVLATNTGTRTGDTYTVRSKLFQPKPEALDRAYAGGRPRGLERYVEVPALPQELESVLGRITRGHETPYRQAVAIQDYLRSFRYDLSAPVGHDTSDIVFFLTESQRGYCEQFAGSMAVLLRMLGIPARVAVGFAPGTPTGDGRWLVTTQDAHAWVEAYFPDHGWIAFEPTPTRSIPLARPYVLPVPAIAMHSLTGLPAQPRGRTAPELSRRRLEEGRSPAETEAGERDPAAAGRRWPLAAILALVAVLAVIALGLARVAARRLALASARSPAERVMTAFRVFEASAADLGAGRKRGETMAEYGNRLDIIRSRDGLRRLTALSVAAAYSTRTPTDTDVSDAVALSRRLTGELRRRVGVTRAAIAVIRPSRPL